MQHSFGFLAAMEAPFGWSVLRSDLAAGLGMGGVLVLSGFRGFWSGPGSRGVGGGVASLRRGAAKRDTIGRGLPSRCDLGCRLPESILDVIQEYRIYLGGVGERMRVCW